MIRTPFRSSGAQKGFTLIELLVVVGILAVVGTGLIASYDGQTKKAGKGKATFDIGALDGAMRTYKVINGEFPSEWDSLLHSDDGSSFVALGSMPSKLQGKLGTYTLTPEAAAALNAAGIESLRYTTGDNTDPTSIPNRVFDNPGRGRGAEMGFSTDGTDVASTNDDGATLAVADNALQVAVVESNGIADFGGSDPGHSERLRDISSGNLDEDLQHVVVAVGVGNNSTFTKQSDDFAGGLSEAPSYPDVDKDEYGRYVALFHVGTNPTPGDTDLANVEYLSTARFVAILDTRGDWLDEELAEFTGQKR